MYSGNPSPPPKSLINSKSGTTTLRKSTVFCIPNLEFQLWRWKIFKTRNRPSHAHTRTPHTREGIPFSRFFATTVCVAMLRTPWVSTLPRNWTLPYPLPTTAGWGCMLWEKRIPQKSRHGLLPGPDNRLLKNSGVPFLPTVAFGMWTSFPRC